MRSADVSEKAEFGYGRVIIRCGRCRIQEPGRDTPGQADRGDGPGGDMRGVEYQQP
jgi:hypothetical protein